MPRANEKGDAVSAAEIPKPSLTMEEGLFSMDYILRRVDLPRVVQCDYTSYSVPMDKSNFDILQPLLLYRKRSVRKIAALSLNVDPSGATQQVGDPLLIPEDYKGWFAMLGDPSAIKVVPHYREVAKLAMADCQTFLIGGTDNVDAVQMVKGKPQPRVLYPGDVLKMGNLYLATSKVKTSFFSKPQTKEERFLLCSDDNDRELLLPIGNTGRFYVIKNKSGKARIPIVQMKDIIANDNVPCVVKLLYGRAPTTPCSFTGVLLLQRVYQESSAIASSIVNLRNILIEIPKDIPLRFQVAVHNNEILGNKGYKDATRLCEDKSDLYMRNIKVSQSVWGDSRFPQSLSATSENPVVTPPPLPPKDTPQANVSPNPNFRTTPQTPPKPGTSDRTSLNAIVPTGLAPSLVRFEDQVVPTPRSASRNEQMSSGRPPATCGHRYQPSDASASYILPIADPHGSEHLYGNQEMFSICISDTYLQIQLPKENKPAAGTASGQETTAAAMDFWRRLDKVHVDHRRDSIPDTVPTGVRRKKELVFVEDSTTRKSVVRVFSPGDREMSTPSPTDQNSVYENIENFRKLRGSEPESLESVNDNVSHSGTSHYEIPVPLRRPKPCRPIQLGPGENWAETSPFDDFELGSSSVNRISTVDSGVVADVGEDTENRPVQISPSNVVTELQRTEIAASNINPDNQMTQMSVSNVINKLTEMKVRPEIRKQFRKAGCDGRRLMSYDVDELVQAFPGLNNIEARKIVLMCKGSNLM